DYKTRHILALGGDTAAHASDVSVKILRVTPTEIRQVTSFDVEMDVNCLEVAPDGQSALIWGGWGQRLWRWRAGAGHQLIAARNVRGDEFGGAFAIIRGEVTTVITQHGVLRGLARDGRELFTANMATPRYFIARGVI